MPTLLELSKKTLKSYLKKSARSLGGNAYAAGSENSNKKVDKAHKRLKGIYRVTDRLANEETEHLDELSRKTLGSYIKKAANHAVDKASAGGYALGHEHGKGNDDDATTGEKDDKKAYSRVQGIKKATDKLTKEETEMSTLVELAQAKNAVDFKKTIEERIQDKVSSILEVTKKEVASVLLTAEEVINECSHDWKGDGKCPKCAEMKKNADKK